MSQLNFIFTYRSRRHQKLTSQIIGEDDQSHLKLIRKSFQNKRNTIGQDMEMPIKQGEESIWMI